MILAQKHLESKTWAASAVTGRKKAVLCRLLLLNSSLFPADYNLLSKISFRFKDFDVIAQCCWFLFIKVALKISLIVHDLVLSLSVTKKFKYSYLGREANHSPWQSRMETENGGLYFQLKRRRQVKSNI